MPGKNDTGPNTANSTSVVETIGPVTCFMALIVASGAGRPSSSITRVTFSTTTMASSTTRPMASTTANIEIVLSENPNNNRNMNTPISETGMVMAGMRVARRLSRKTNTTSSTMMPVMTRVWVISSIEADTNRVES